MADVDIAFALALLQAEVERDPNGKAGVARKLGKGCGRVLLSRVLSPRDDLTMSPQLAERVVAVYHQSVTCPATQQVTPRADCLRIASSAAPTHNPRSMQVWKTCKACPHNPVSNGGKQP